MKARLMLTLLTAAAVLLAGSARADRPQMPSDKVEKAVPKYERFVRAFGYQPDEFQTYAVGQSHIDIAWKWRMAQTHKKVYVTFTHALDVMDREPDFVFAGSQVAMYEWYEQDHPAEFARLVAAVKRGQWETVGGSWVEPDGNMPDGEAWVRQRLLGQRWYMEHFGRITNIEWMPDSFGYNWNLPQIIARSGGKYIWCKKIIKNFRNMFPFHAFHWQAPDGSRVIASLCPNTAGDVFFPFQEVFPFGMVRYLLKPGVKLTADYTTPGRVIRAATSKDRFLMIGDFYGEGDGGNGPQDNEVEIQKRMRDQGYVKFTHAQNFFDDLAAIGDRLPVWNDELYLETHRGTLTTQGWIKRANRRAEGMMRTIEPLTAFLSRFGEPHPSDAIKSLWKMICLLQFHDILPGSSIPEVYEDARRDHAAVAQSQDEILSGALAALAKKIRIEPPAGTRPVLVYNPLGFRRSDNVTAPAPAGAWHVVDGQGRALVSQEVGDGLMFRAEDLPSLGWRVYYLAPGEGPKESGVQVTEDRMTYTLANQFVRVKVCKARGLIVSLVDKRTGRELIAGDGNRIVSFFDHHYEYQAWDISPWYKLNPILVPESARVSVTLRGPLAVEVLVVREMWDRGEKTVFEQRVRLIDGDPLVHLDFDSDYHLKDSLTKLQFSTTIHPRVAVADGAYATISRSTHPRRGLDDSRWEMSCQKWLDISDDSQGLAILNNGKYGFSYLNGGSIIRQTLIKGATYPAADSAAEDVTHYEHWYQLPFTDQGRHHIELALYPHAGDWRAARLWLAGYAFNTPAQAVAVEAGAGELPAEGSFLAVDAATTYVGNVKRAEDDDDLVVRLVEAAGRADHVVLRPGLGLKLEAAALTDLLEWNPQPLAPAGGAVEVPLSPFEVKTVKIKVSR